MATQVFSDAELERLRGFPEVDREVLVRFFTLTPSDETFLRSHRGSVNRLGLAVQLCTLPWLGFVPDDIEAAPVQAVARLADHLRVPASALSSYGAREQTRTDHLAEVAKLLGWRQAGEVEWKELDQFLTARGLEHDSPSLLFRLACDYLRSAKVIRPGPDWLSRRVAAAREVARADGYEPSTLPWPWASSGRAATRSMTKCWLSCPRPTTRTSASTAPSPSRWTGSWPPSPAATGPSAGWGHELATTSRAPRPGSAPSPP